MARVENISLDRMLGLSSKLDGTKLYKITKSSSEIFTKDLIIKAILDCNKFLYHYRKKFDYYGYEKSNQVFFDKEKNPYWKAFFSNEFFRLYDGIFLGHYGCGGYQKYLGVINRARSDLLSSDSGEILERYNEFYKRYSSQRDEVVSSRIRAQFGIGKKNTGKGIIEYLRFENDDENKDVFIFWNWFLNDFIDEAEYERKIKIVTPAEHKRVFKKYVRKYIKIFEDAGFRRVEK